MVKITTTPPASKQDGVFGSACVDLVSVARDGENLFVLVSDGAHNWLVRCTAKDLQTFPAFQRVMADRYGVWIRHESQEHDGRSAARRRADDWQYHVRRAFDVGGQR